MSYVLFTSRVHATGEVFIYIYIYIYIFMHTLKPIKQHTAAAAHNVSN